MAFSNATVLAAWQRAGGRCECGRSNCGHGPWRCRTPMEYAADYFDYNDYAPDGWEAHHKVPVYQGGSDTLANCQILCIPCHKKTPSYGGR